MAKLRSSNIEPSTATTLALGASGDSVLISSDSLKANTWQDLGANNYFVSDGSGTLSNINSALAGGGYTLLSTQTASSSASLVITTSIDSTYDEYMFVYTDINAATDATQFSFQCSTDGGSNYNTTMTTTACRASHPDSGGSGVFGYDSNFDQDQDTGYQLFGEPGTPGLGNGAAENMSGILHLFTPSSTTYVKQFYATSNYYQSNDRTNNSLVAGYFNTTSAINAISFKMASGNINAGVVQMYGVS